MSDLYLLDGSEGIDYKHLSFIQEFHKLEKEKKENIIIHLSTVGGDFSVGMAIFDCINMSKVPTTIIGYGNVCSVGTIIMQAASKRCLTPNCDFMVHFGDSYIEGNQKYVENTAEYYKNLKSSMLDIYAERCRRFPFYKKKFKTKVVTREKVRRYLEDKMNQHQDWYLKPIEALELGLIDQVLTKTTYNNVRIKKI